MSLDQLKDEVVHLAPREQRELMAFMVALQTEKDEEFRRQLARKIDDREPAHWMELNQVREKLSRHPLLD